MYSSVTLSRPPGLSCWTSEEQCQITSLQTSACSSFTASPYQLHFHFKVRPRNNTDTSVHIHVCKHKKNISLFVSFIVSLKKIWTQPVPSFPGRVLCFSCRSRWRGHGPVCTAETERRRRGRFRLILDVITLSHTVHDSQERRWEGRRACKGGLCHL